MGKSDRWGNVLATRIHFNFKMQIRSVIYMVPSYVEVSTSNAHLPLTNIPNFWRSISYIGLFDKFVAFSNKPIYAKSNEFAGQPTYCTKIPIFFWACKMPIYVPPTVQPPPVKASTHRYKKNCVKPQYNFFLYFFPFFKIWLYKSTTHVNKTTDYIKLKW
ncbi:hypothetical protein CHUAL_011435 [Chamberlinius hualienensis]